MNIFDAFKGKEKIKEDVLTQPLPIVAPDLPIIEDLTQEAVNKNKDVDAMSLIYLVWVMYKLNVITRIQVRDFLDIIKKGDWPKDVVKWLSDEVKKL